MSKTTHRRYDNCPSCGGLKRDTSRWCLRCSRELHRDAAQKTQRLIELARERKAQARIDAVARSLVPEIARVE